MQETTQLRSETHITVSHESQVDLERWVWLCRDVLEIKPLHIQLTQGRFPSQLMCAARRLAKDTNSVGQFVKQLEDKIKESNFNILRIKIEFEIDHSHRIQNPVYFECHYKFLVPKPQQKLFLYHSRKFQLAASRNILRADDGLEKWYLTMRLKSPRSPYVAQKEFEFVGLQLKDQFVDLFQGQDMECVAYDSNTDLDDGWLSVC